MGEVRYASEEVRFASTAKFRNEGGEWVERTYLYVSTIDGKRFYEVVLGEDTEKFPNSWKYRTELFEQMKPCDPEFEVIPLEDVKNIRLVQTND